MKSLCLAFLGLSATCLMISSGMAQEASNVVVPAPAATPVRDGKTETLVFFRHGEKPAGDQGQLSPRGLNRALALPVVLMTKFGRPDFLFAPGTTKKTSKEGTFSYLRPLMTIEPLAIRLGFPVETRFAYQETEGLEKELTGARYQGSVVFIAWEHHELDALVRHLVGALGGKPDTVPEWPGDDFDSLFVVTIHTGQDGAHRVTFAHEHEGLDGLSDELPEVKLK